MKLPSSICLFIH